MTRILVVDDERGMRITMSRILEGEGYQVETAGNSLEALEHLKKQSFEVVISDIIMPHVGGMDLLKTLTGEHPDTKVIMITGEPTVDTASESFRTGAFDYLSKPVNKATILRTVERALHVRRLENKTRLYEENLERMVEERTAELLESNKALEREINERREAEQAVRRSEVRFRELAELLPEIVYELDADGKVTFINKAGLEITGYTEEDFKRGFSGFDLFPEDERPRLIKAFVEYMKGNHFEPTEYTACRKTGERFPVLARSTPIVADGKVLGLRGIFLDISTRKRAEIALAESEEKYRTLFETMAEGVVYQNRDRTITSLNAAARKILGLGDGDPVGLKAVSADWSVIQEDGKEISDAVHPVKQALLTGKPQVAVLGVRNRASGKRIWLYVNSIPQFRPGESAPYQAYATFADITKQKEAELELLKHQRRLRALTGELTLIEERERRNIAQDLHDNIGQILALAKIKLGLLRQESSDPAQQEKIQETFELISRIVKHIQQVTFELSSLQIYEGDIVAAVEDLASELFDVKSHPVEVRSNGQDLHVNLEAGSILYRSIRELFYNVLKHAGPCRVYVTLKEFNGEFKVVVADEGCGFDASQLDLLPSEDRHFGLFSIKERFEVAGGSFQLDSKPGQGVRVMLTLPLHSDGEMDGSQQTQG